MARRPHAAPLRPRPRPLTIRILAIGGTALKSRLTIVGLAALAAVLLRVFWPEPDAVAPELARSLEPGREQSPGANAERARALAPAPAQSMAERAVPALPAATPASGWWLVGEIAGPPEEEPPRTRVAIHRALYEGPLATWTSGRRLELALEGELLARFDVDGFAARFDHPEFLPQERWIALPAARALAAGERRELACRIALRPPAGIVAGRVRGAGIGAGSRFGVALLSVDAQGEPRSGPVEHAPCDEQGRYHLRAETAGEHVVVAAELPHERADREWTAATRPESAQVALAHGLSRTVDFWIGGGERIAGRVVDERGSPLEGCELRAVREPRIGKSVVVWPGVQLAWIDGRFEHGEFRATTAADGSFELRGLRAGLHRLTWESFLQPRLETGGLPVVSSRLSGDASGRGTIVSAPAEGLELRAAWRTIDLRVRGRGAHVGRCMLQVSFPGGWATTSVAFDEGRIFVQFPGDADVALKVSAEGWRTQRTLVHREDQLPDGILELVLEPLPPPASLALDFTLVGLELPLKLRCELEALSPEPADGEAVPELFGRQRAVELELFAAGLSEVGSFDPGRYRVSLELGTKERLRELAVPCSFELELPPGERVVHPVRLVLGGRFALEVQGAGSREERLSLELFDASGEQLEWYAAATDARRGGAGRATVVPRAGRNETGPALAPGDYYLVPRIGRRDLAPIPFTIEAGEITELHIDLDA